ncbi:MAG: taurine dioxygenase, partial [Gammaproteobacteria bacterium]
MQVISSGGPLGGEITGIDLSHDISDADREFIFNTYLDKQVLLFRGQSLSFDDLLRLRELFGPAGMTANQLLGLGRKEYYPDEVPTEITIISNIVRE